MTQEYKNVGEILVEEGILSQDELGEVLEKSKSRNLPLEETLFKLGYISRDRLGALLAQVYGCEFIDLNVIRVDEQALGLLPSEIALKARALPYAAEEDSLSVALAGPFEEGAAETTLEELERASGKKIRFSLCNPELLQQWLSKCYGTAGTEPSRIGQNNVASLIESIKADDVNSTLRAQLEEVWDVGQTALIASRSHPFSRSVASSIDEARTKLSDSRKYADSGFEEEAVELAEQAVSILREASAKADAAERDWEKLVQQVKNLRSRIGALEDDGAAEYAPAEYEELSEIRDSLLECVNERNVDRLRSLMDQGIILMERVNLLSPDRNRGREQVIASLARVRSVIARARKVGAKEYAPEALKEAYGYLDAAEKYARRAQWEDVRECLASAETKAVEAEQAALRIASEREGLTIKLRETIRVAASALEDAMAHPFAQEVIVELMRCRDSLGEAKSCFDTAELERGIELAARTERQIREEIVPHADQTEQSWNELFRKADVISMQIQSLDMSFALIAASEKIEALLQAEREMVNALCKRDRENLSGAISKCETLVREIYDVIDSERNDYERVQDAIEDASSLLDSATALCVDERVASAYEEARRLLEEAKNAAARGNVRQALDNALSAGDKFRAEVIERQKNIREKMFALIPHSTELFRRIDEASSPEALHYCPDLLDRLRAQASEMVSAFAATDWERIEACVVPIEETINSIGGAIGSAKAERYRHITQQVEEIEDSVKTAVQRCSGSYAPDMLEHAYIELNRVKEHISKGPDELNAELEKELLRDLAVARTRVWQVEFLRERFEREREETLRQLRLKMDQARETLESCRQLPFADSESPLLEKARNLLEQADNLLIEGDIEESFAVVRDSQAAADELREEAFTRERRWKELADTLLADEAPHRQAISDPAAGETGYEEYRRLCDLCERTPAVVEERNLESLEGHAAALEEAAKALAERIREYREREQRGIEEKINRAQREIRVAELMKADEFCPEIINAARSYVELSETFRNSKDLSRAESAARDALAKARDAATLARAATERSTSLAIDYMKIASAKMEQQDLEAARRSLESGLSLAERSKSAVDEQDADQCPIN